MQPDAVAVLNGVKQVIFNVLMPELQTDQARQQAMLSSILLDHLVARWDVEIPLLLEERTELRALLSEAATVADAEELTAAARDALAGSDAPVSEPRGLDRANEPMRALVSRLVAHPAVGAAARRYIHNQHRRDQQLVQVGALGW